MLMVSLEKSSVIQLFSTLLSEDGVLSDKKVHEIQILKCRKFKQVFEHTQCQKLFERVNCGQGSQRCQCRHS